jgi:hypothetical protein
MITALLLCTITLAQPARAADRPRNIFDDDWTPPKTAEKPRAPATVIPPTAPVPDPVKTPTPNSPTPKPTSPVAPQPPARLPVPAKPAQAAVCQVMKEVFAEQLADRSVPARRKLAAALLAQADKSSQVPTDQFVLLAAVIDAAVDAVNLPAAFQAADRMAETFDVDGLGVKADAALRLGPKSALPDSAAENIDAVLALSNDLARADDYATAARVCAALQPAAARDPSLRAQLQQRQREIVTARDAADRFARDLTKLKESPDDPAANLAVGRYACLVKGDWDGGLPLLAKGSDATLKALAARELAHSTTADETAAVADAWWDAATKTDPLSRTALIAHAVSLYERSATGITGLRKAQIEKRLAEASKPIAAAFPKPVIVSVQATDVSKHPVKTALRVSKGQQFLVTPDPDGRWTGGGSKAGKFCDYRGYFPDKNDNWMKMCWRVGAQTAPVIADKPIEAQEDGEIELFCSDSNPDGNSGEIKAKVEVKR